MVVFSEEFFGLVPDGDGEPVVSLSGQGFCEAYPVDVH